MLDTRKLDPLYVSDPVARSAMIVTAAGGVGGFIVGVMLGLEWLLWGLV